MPELPYGVEALTEVLSERRGGVVRFTVPKRGAKDQLLATAHENAVGALQQYKLKRTADYVARTQAMHDVQEALELPEAPLRIECFDISHLGGTGIVGSMVVFEDGLPKKSQYRRFNIASARDDTDSMDQVLRRRLKHLDQDAESLAAEAEAQQNPNAPTFAYRPQLFLIDGGLPQVNAAQRALDASGVTGIAIAGLAKRLEELWLPGEEFPVILPRNSEALFLLQRLRDEAHRFAITAQRNSRVKALGTSLDAIPGLGPARVQALLTHFGSVKRLAAANEDEISSVPGIGVETARRILAALR